MLIGLDLIFLPLRSSMRLFMFFLSCLTGRRRDGKESFLRAEDLFGC